ncbi:MAG: hypothetical protein COA84_13285 [Robiginitomaculum sp.]|nr:MAG: hypothetical protein COA84_13285 [Robiginitomaculum sp.]
MNLEEIGKAWNEDAIIDVTNIVGESSETPKLHHKYLMMLLQAKREQRVRHVRLTKLKKLKQDWFLGRLDKSELNTLGWEQCQILVPLKSEMNKYIDQDNDVIALNSIVGEGQDKVYYLEEILRQINSRGFQIKSIIDWSRFQSGG